MRKWFYPFFFLCIIFAEAKVPELSPGIVRSKMDQIFRDHASYKKMNEELIQRTLINYLDKLDPTKTYLLEGEISAWLYPPNDLIKKTLQEFERADYSLFFNIHQVMVSAIERRERLEAQIAGMNLPEGVTNEEFKEMAWAQTEEELATRLLRIRALQLEAASRLEDETQGKFMQRLEKRRINREAELIGATPDEQRKLVLANVLKAASESLDPHTNYFTPSEANQFMFQIQQRLCGIGAQLRDDLNGLTIMRIFEKSPAAISGKLKIGDRIIAVNKEPVVGMDITEAVELIRGEKETPVLLTIIREGEDGEHPLEVELIRNEVVFEETRLETHVEPYGDGVIAILKLYSFYQDPQFSSATDIRKALDEIKQKHNLRGVLLDLRNNGGGLIGQAVAVTGLFIHKGIVVSVKNNSGQVHHLRELEGTPAWEGPLIVVVNRLSASASEIVAQTLQDYGRALLVGDDHTFGKGTFQTFTLDAVKSETKVNPEGEFKVTRGRYYTVSGKSPQLVGVSSDIVIPGLISKLDVGEQFSKFPLENDQITPHFEDDLSDLSPLYRRQLGPLYRYDLQHRLTTLQPFLGTLRENSRIRIESNPNYQNFLKELEKKNFDAPQIDVFYQSDLQMVEAINTMKDLLYLLVSEEPLAS